MFTRPHIVVTSNTYSAHNMSHIGHLLFFMFTSPHIVDTSNTYSAHIGYLWFWLYRTLSHYPVYITPICQIFNMTSECKKLCQTFNTTSEFKKASTAKL